MTTTSPRRRFGAAPRLAGMCNVVMAVAVALAIAITEVTWDSCVARLDAGRVSLESCQQQMTDGHARSFLLALAWLVGDAVVAGIWLRRRHAAGRRSAPVTWAALVATFVGISTMLKVGNLVALPALLVVPGAGLAIIALGRRDAGGRRDEIALASAAIGGVGIAIGVTMQVVA